MGVKKVKTEKSDFSTHMVGKAYVLARIGIEALAGEGTKSKIRFTGNAGYGLKRRV